MVFGTSGHRLVALASICASSAAFAGLDSETWFFDETTTGQTVLWNSPTAVDPAAGAYDSTYVITLVEVDVSWLGFTFNDIDVTDQVPPDQLTSTSVEPGPAPVVIADQAIVAPPPPDPPAVAGDLVISLDAAGFGRLTASNIVLGTTVADLGIFGMQTVNIESIRIAGSVTVTAIPPCEGDTDGNGFVDIDDIVNVVLDFGTDGATNGGDADGSGFVDIDDIVLVVLNFGTCPGA
jgi:hypothetical protein